MTRCEQCHSFVDLAAKLDAGIGWLCLDCLISNLTHRTGKAHR